MQKWMPLKKNHILRCWDSLSFLNRIGAPTLSLLLKQHPRPCSAVWSFFLLRLLCISINLPYDLAWNNVFICWLVLLAGRYVTQTKNRICRTVSLLFVVSLEPVTHRQNVASLSLFYRYYFGRCLSELPELVPLQITGPLVILIGCIISMSSFADVLRIYFNSFFSRTARLWSFLSAKYFPLTCHVYGFKSRVNRHVFELFLNSFLLSFSSFVFFIFLVTISFAVVVQPCMG